MRLRETIIAAAARAEPEAGAVDAAGAFVQSMRQVACAPAPIETFFDVAYISEREANDTAALLTYLSSRSISAARALSFAVTEIMIAGLESEDHLLLPAGTFQYDGKLFPRFSAFHSRCMLTGILSASIAALSERQRVDAVTEFARLYRESGQMGESLSIVKELYRLSIFVLGGLPAALRREIGIQRNVYGLSERDLVLVGAILSGPNMDRMYKEIRGLEVDAARAINAYESKDLAAMPWVAYPGKEAEFVRSVGTLMTAGPDVTVRERLMRGVRVPHGLARFASETFSAALAPGDRLVGEMSDLPDEIIMSIQANL